MKKIIIENLKVTELSEIMYGSKHSLDGFTTKQINTLIQDNKEALQSIYNKIDNEEYESIGTTELYILGDIINLLDAIRYRKPKQQK